MRKYFSILSLMFVHFCVIAQDNAMVYSKFATAQNRKQFCDKLIADIRTNLAKPLSDSTQEQWQDAFGSIALLGFKEEWVFPKIKEAFNSFIPQNDPDWHSTLLDSVKSAGQNTNNSFKRSLLEMVYTVYPRQFDNEVGDLIWVAVDNKIFAMCVEYIMLNESVSRTALHMNLMMLKRKEYQSDPILQQLIKRLRGKQTYPSPAMLRDLVNLDYLKGNTILYSIQRRNRDYPGIVIIKDINGNFLKDPDGQLFCLPQLARSVSNLPGYLTNGNTPQGLFRMDGFAISKSNFIGPTVNVQLKMPFEDSIWHFLKDSSITDTIWTENLYKKLLPASWENDEYIMGSYFASKIGRTEIIAHGTAVDPSYYKGQSYYPFTPTAGCLATKEIWFADGTRASSDQQQLVEAIKRAGGPDGYVIVIELDDQQKPVTLQDITPFTGPIKQ